MALDDVTDPPGGPYGPAPLTPTDLLPSHHPSFLSNSSLVISSSSLPFDDALFLDPSPHPPSRPSSSTVVHLRQPAKALVDSEVQTADPVSLSVVISLLRLPHLHATGNWSSSAISSLLCYSIWIILLSFNLFRSSWDYSRTLHVGSLPSPHGPHPSPLLLRTSLFRPEHLHLPLIAPTLSSSLYNLSRVSLVKRLENFHWCMG